MPHPTPASEIHLFRLIPLGLEILVPLLFFWLTAIRRARPEDAQRTSRHRNPVLGALVLQACLLVLTLVLLGLFSNILGRCFHIRTLFLMLRIVDEYLFAAFPLVLFLLLMGHGLFVPASRRSPSWTLPVLVLLLVLNCLIGVEAHFLCPTRLTLETVSVPLPAVPPSRTPVRIALVGDIQSEAPAAFEARAMAEVNAARPDLILLLGDYFHDTVAGDFEAHLPALRNLLRSLRAPHGIFAIEGDFEDRDRLLRIVEGTSITPLFGERVSLEIRGLTLHLYGFGNSLLGPPAGHRYRQLRRGVDRPGVHLLMAHQPDILFHLPADSGPDLVVAGHTHGGQVCLPWIGPLVNFQKLPLKYSSGLHTVNGQRIYVTRGIGMERSEAPRIRFLCPPEITLLTLVPR